MRKRELWAFTLLAVAGIAGFAYQQHGKALDFNRANCIADHGMNEGGEAACECFVDALGSRVSFAYSIPLVGPLFAPEHVKSGAVVDEALAVCGLPAA